MGEAGLMVALVDAAGTILAANGAFAVRAAGRRVYYQPAATIGTASKWTNQMSEAFLSIADHGKAKTVGEMVGQRIGDYDAFVGRSATKLPAEVLKRATRLKVIGRAGVGTESGERARLLDRPRIGRRKEEQRAAAAKVGPVHRLSDSSWIGARLST